ncbi:hypothetical protein D3C86_1318010 [compost metagenome]
MFTPIVTNRLSKVRRLWRSTQSRLVAYLPTIQSLVRRLQRCRRFSCPGVCGLSQRAQSIGVRVNDTTSETTMAAARVMENSRNRLSMIPPMNRIDRNTATSDTFIDSKVKPTSWAPRYAALIGRTPSSMCREMFSSTTMASSTTSPVARISAISDRLFSEKP